MHHTHNVVGLLALATIGTCFSQDIPSDASKALQREWKKPETTKLCLTALRLYTRGVEQVTVYPGTVIGSALSPEEAQDKALKVLIEGVATTAERALYRVAKNRADFLQLLEEATTLYPIKSDTSKRDTPKPMPENELFARVQAIIDLIYQDNKEGLYGVQKSATPPYHEALSRLLDAYAAPETANQSYADALEILRAGFKLNRDRLFKLVNDKNPPEKE